MPSPTQGSRSVWANVIANFAGQGVSVALALAFIPVYVRVLGIEAYGVIGFYLSLQALFFIFDFGLASTLNRELARLTHGADRAEGQRDLVRTLEWVYWPLGVAVALAVVALSGSIAQGWLKPVHISVQDTRHAIILMGLAISLQWPTALYGGGLRGLERQVTLNVLGSGISILRSVGSVAVLLLVSPTLAAFLWWQVIVAGVQSILYRWALWKRLPGAAAAPRFRMTIICELQAFTLGLTGVAVLSFLLTQSDRVILSRLLPLDEFGVYSLAITVASVLSSMIGPFFNAFFPRYSALVAGGQDAELAGLYHLSNQLLVMIVASAAAVICVFSRELLTLWTGDPALAAKAAPILSLLVAGTALHGFLHLPYALQLAYGWTRLALVQNIASVVVVVPAIYVLGSRFGGIGAASVWVGLNVASICIGVPHMHRRLLRGELGRWFGSDLLPPLLAAVAAAIALKQSVHVPASRTSGVLVLAGISCTTLAAAFLASNLVRRSAAGLLASAGTYPWARTK